MERVSRRWHLVIGLTALAAVGTVLVVTVVVYGGTRASQSITSTALEDESPTNTNVDAHSRHRIAPGILARHCDRPTVMAYLVSGSIAPAADVVPATVLSASAASMRGTLRRPQGETPPAAGIPATLGGQFKGRGSCDFTLADNTAAAQLAPAGAAALAAKGVPLATNGTMRPGEQRYLLRSAAFRDTFAYILYIVPDPTSAEPNLQGGQTYTRNIYAVAVIGEDGTVAYAAPLAP